MEGSGRGIEYEVMSLDEKNKVILYKTEGNFKTDLDLYGGMDCLSFQKINSAVDLDLTCEFVDQNNDKMWASLIRKTEDIDAGVGRVFIIGGTEDGSIYQDLIANMLLNLINQFGLLNNL